MFAEINLQIVLLPEESMAYWACMYGFVSSPTAKNAEIGQEHQIPWPPPPAYNFKLTKGTVKINDLMKLSQNTPIKNIMQ